MTVNPAIRGIVETCINVADINRARHFYESLFGFEPMAHSERFCAYPVGTDVLLLFMQGGSDNSTPVADGVIPPHNTIGAGHFALAVSIDELTNWQARMNQLGIKEESEVRWERGGRSIYFRDPDGNLLELATPGIWANY